jgi:hypothetical protein
MDRAAEANQKAPSLASTATPTQPTMPFAKLPTPTSEGRSSGYIASSSSPYTGSTSVPPIPTRASSYHGSDTTVRNRAGGGYNIYNWKTGDDVTLSPRAGDGYNGYNWKTGDDYTIKPKGDGKWNAYNWKTGDDYDVKVRPGGRTEIYNWKTGEYIDAD